MMAVVRTTLAILGLLVTTSHAGEAKTLAVVIVPHRSIGPVVLGDRVPVGTQVEGGLGARDGITFAVEGDRIRDVWIVDLRVFPQPVRLGHRTLDPKATVADLKAQLGPCERAVNKQGVFYNCRAGITLGLDFSESGRFVSLRLEAQRSRVVGTP